jgi:hypothetical protein
MLTDDELDVRLNLADPVRGVQTTADALRELTAATRRASRRRRGWRIGISVGALAAVILGGAVAAPAVGIRYLAETLWHPVIGGEITSKSEWIDTSAPDAAAFIRQANPRWIPLPPGLTREQEIVAVSKSFTDNPGLTQASTIRQSYEAAAYCAWIGSWQDAHEAGDSIAESAAAKVMHQATKWPDIVASDGGGIVAHMKKSANAADAGDATAVAFEAQIGDCVDFPRPTK